MQIFVKNNRTWVIDVELTDTVLSVKQKIEDIDGIPVRYQSLRYAGRVLEDLRTLEEYGVFVESTIYYCVKSPVRQAQTTTPESGAQ